MSRYWDDLEAQRLDERVGSLWWNVLTGGTLLCLFLLLASRVLALPYYAFVGIGLLFIIFVVAWMASGSSLSRWALRSVDNMRKRRRRPA